MPLVLSKIVDITGDPAISQNEVTSDGQYIYTFSVEQATFPSKAFRVANALSYSFTANPTGTNETLNDVFWSGDLLVAVGTNGTILTSTDGVAWSPQVSGTAEHLQAVNWNGLQWLAVGANNTALTSPEGVVWTPQTTTLVGEDLYGVAWSGNRYVVVGTNGAVASSADSGVTWITRVSLTANDLRDVNYNGTIFTAVGISGTIITSSDNGTNWTVQVSGSLQDLNAVAWDDTNTIYVVVGNNGTILTSPTGAAVWTPRFSGVLANMNEVTFTNNKYLAVGDSGIILSSPDGLAWSLETSGVPNNLLGVTNFTPFAVIVGQFGLSLETPLNSGLVQFYQTVPTNQLVEYQLEVVMRLYSGDAPRVYLRSDSMAVLGELTLTGIDRHYRKFTVLTSPAPIGATTVTLLFETGTSQVSDYEVAFARLSSNSSSNHLVNPEFDADVSPLDGMPDGWALIGTPYVRQIVDEKEDQIINIYKCILNGFNLDNVMGGTNFWYQIKIESTLPSLQRLFHITSIGGASYLATENYGERISFVYSILDDAGARTELILLRPADRHKFVGLINNTETPMHYIDASVVAKAPTGSPIPGSPKDVLAIFEEDHHLQVYNLPVTNGGNLTLIGTFDLEIGGIPNGVEWDSNENKIVFTTEDSLFTSGLPALLYVDLMNPTAVTRFAALPEINNTGITVIYDRVLVARNTSATVGYFVDDAPTPEKIIENWSDIQIPADGTSERTLTLTVLSNFTIPMGAGIEVTVEGFKAASSILRPTDFFDGQSLNDISLAQAVTATAEDRGAASNINDGFNDTKWAVSVGSLPASVTIDLGIDYSVEYLYYDAKDASQKFTIELLSSVNAVLYTINETAAFSDPKRLFQLNLNPPITTTRKVRLTLTDTTSLVEAKCHNLQVLVDQGTLQNGRFYVPGSFGVSEKDTSIFPYVVRMGTDQNGNVILTYRSGTEAGYAPQKAVFSIE